MVQYFRIPRTLVDFVRTFLKRVVIQGWIGRIEVTMLKDVTIAESLPRDLSADLSWL
jgi:hypothetical protein